MEFDLNDRGLPSSPARRKLLGQGAAFALATIVPSQQVRCATRQAWRHGIVQAKGDSGFFYMAQRQGYMERRGLLVEILEFKGGKDVVRALLAGELDSADIEAVETLSAVEKGASLRFVGSSILGFPYALFVRPEITSWQQLADKRFGISAPGSTPHVMSLAMLRAKGVSAARVQFMNAGGSAGRIKALAAGRLDAVAASSEFIPLAQQLGIKVFIHSRDIVPEFPRFFVVASAKTLKARPEQTIQFLAGYLEGLRYCAEHRDATIKLAAEIDGSGDTVRYAYIFDEVTQRKLLSLNMEIPVDRIRWVHDLMLNLGELSGPLNVNPLVVGQYREAALKLLQSA
ncbi:ABC transporter substrate-binding protein [Quatrionicoccus australiensis]|uniref:ABC transporter substrate-binding protein n=1 Tax=Quatrionicoccus australiensis TaxID=138118 RepID=UPI001CF7EF67|nr:ABC transporter substrate-binding protein [Quatrionicoccus australiensis]UCV15720.1 ABC transporter substrate-binding protein [Quatrionicoccus australiensis]